MKMKRLVASFGATFEQFVNKVENHEAVAASAIADVRAGAAKLKVQLARVETQSKRLGDRRDMLAKEAGVWRDRARRLQDDESKALECVRRMERATFEAKAVTEQCEEFEHLAKQLRARLGQVETRIADLQLKRTELASRSIRARAYEAPDVELDVNEVFDRWEISVVEGEYRSGAHDEEFDRDALHRDLAADEEEAHLRAVLQRLRDAEDDS